MVLMAGKEYWRKRLQEVTEIRADIKRLQKRRREIITDAHDKGGIAYAEISKILGDIKRLQVINIVKAVRQERNK